MNDTPLTFFTDQLDKHREELSRLTSRYNVIATVRILTFLIFLIGFVIAANYRLGWLMGAFALGFPFIFGSIVKLHNRIAYDKKQCQHLLKINEQEINRLNQNFNNLTGGEEYMSKEHPYINDLDVFGKSSIFKLLNRTTTRNGRNYLAYLLSHPASPGEVLKRQEAVRELTPLVTWRQDLQASGMHHNLSDEGSEALIAWINTPKPISKAFLLLSYVLPLVLITSITLNLLTSWPNFVSILLALGSGIVINRFQEQIKSLTDNVVKHIGLLKTYSAFIHGLEESTFESSRLQELKNKVEHDKMKASTSVHQLHGILELLEARSNFFYMIVDIILLQDLHIIRRAENWKARNKGDVGLWFDAVSELEALNSLAGFSFAFPEYIYPKPLETHFHLKLTKLGHPLIPKAERVSNNFHQEGKGSLSIITGSNMSGKSTFLRTLGVNLVLAQAGAVVCAEKFEFSTFQVFTSMRTQDNLEEHVSSFYAELKRIQMLLKQVEEKLPVFYMLDEILKGTNSEDRHMGAVSLAKQLAKTNSMGLISTHDLALGKLAADNNQMTNYSFNSDIIGDEIIFPYKLEPGICKSFNASKLMENIGIAITTENSTK